jgi:hypothetical protein
MKVLILLLCALGLCQLSFADDSSTPQIRQVDPNVPVDQMAAPGVHIQHATDPEEGGYHLPLPIVRDQAFEKAGIRGEIASWDQLDRDMLYLRARDMKLPEVLKRYPSLPSAKLTALSNNLKLKASKR